MLKQAYLILLYELFSAIRVMPTAYTYRCPYKLYMPTNHNPQIWHVDINNININRYWIYK